MAIVNQENVLSILMNMNPWWQTGMVPKALVKEFKRNGYHACMDVLENDIRRMVILSGMRRTGKTTIMYQLITELLNRGVKPQDILFFTFDHPVIRMIGLEDIVRIYRENISNAEKFYIFVDEIQFNKEWPSYLKMLYDLNPGLQAVATGSASALLEGDVKESGAGRWTVLKIPTLSFYEYCEIKGVHKQLDTKGIEVFKMHVYSQQEQSRIILGLSDLQIHLMKYLSMGGFPELALTENITYAQKLLREDIIDRAIKQDLPAIYGVRSLEELEKVFVYLCYNSASIINIETMCKEFNNVSRPTIEKYIRYLESANLIYISRQLNIQGKKVLKSQNKIYIADSAIRGSVVLDADIYTKEGELGYALETSAYKHTKDYFAAKNSLYDVGYIRDGKGAEIDIAVQYSGKPYQYIEAKMRHNSSIKDDNGIVVYGLEDVPGYVITRNGMDYGLTARGKTSLYRIPAFAYLYLIGQKR